MAERIISAESSFFADVVWPCEFGDSVSDYFFDSRVAHDPVASGFLVDSVTSVFSVLDEDIVKDLLVRLGNIDKVAEEVFTSSTVVYFCRTKKAPLRFGTGGIVLTPLGGAVPFAPRFAPVHESRLHEDSTEVIVLPDHRARLLRVFERPLAEEERVSVNQ